MIFKRLREDISSIYKRDPAPRSTAEILFCYPGVHALVFYRLAHALWTRKFFFLGRLISHIGRLLTGIEIHPGAKIGRRLFIDHGFGVVIGETAEIGDDVTLYHDVTLGGISLHKAKRHPTLMNAVIVGAGAQVLGPVTVGEGARIGANAVVLSDVPPGETMVGIPAMAVEKKESRTETDTEDFQAYGVPDESVPDPLICMIKDLQKELDSVRTRMGKLEKKYGGEGKSTHAQAGKEHEK